MASLYTTQQVSSWSQISQNVWDSVSATAGQTAATIATATGLSVEQVYWALANPPLDANQIPQQYHVIPSSDSEFLVIHGPKIALRGHV